MPSGQTYVRTSHRYFISRDSKDKSNARRHPLCLSRRSVGGHRKDGMRFVTPY